LLSALKRDLFEFHVSCCSSYLLKKLSELNNAPPQNTLQDTSTTHNATVGSKFVTKSSLGSVDITG
jgi:hypothetical protein